MQPNIRVFKEICLDLHAASDKPYEHVVLKVLQTKYRLLLPEEMEVPDIAYVLNIHYKQVNNMLKLLLGTQSPSTGKIHKSRLKTFAHHLKLKDTIPDEQILPDDIEHQIKD
jgi:hypothetical protein